MCLECRYYSHLEWEEKSRRDEEYLRNCAEYPIGKHNLIWRGRGSGLGAGIHVRVNIGGWVIRSLVRCGSGSGWESGLLDANRTEV
jgi:hypothetical protein